jgi:ParB family chromosome partitioning protein
MSNAKPKKELMGQGIRSLLKGIDTEMKNPEGNLKTDVVEKATSMVRVPLDQIEINPKQPRQDFDETALRELSESIRIHDIIQPLTVSRMGANRYRLIAGERRLRAARMAGLKDVPVYIREADDQQLLEMALLENLQRQDLNAIEIGQSYKRLMDECSLTQEEVAARMGMERSTVANFIRLLKLPPSIVIAVRENKITMGHAKNLITLDTVDRQMQVFKEIVSKHLSVRQTEELVRTQYSDGKVAKGGKQKQKKGQEGLTPMMKKIEDTICSHFGTRARLISEKKGHGRIVLEYYSLEELNGLLDKMKITVQ